MARFQNNVAIAFADSYFQACRKLPQSVLRDEMTFRQKFTSDPTAPGLNYERINASDNSLRSVRVNRGYRVIVKTPDKDAPNVFTLMWIDSHDDAYAWAEKKRIAVNPVTNAIEIYNVIEHDEEATVSAAASSSIFNDISEHDFRILGINDTLQKMIQSVSSWEAFEEIQPYLPRRVFESIAFLHEGIPVEEILETMGDTAREPMRFEEAVMAPGNADQFFVVDSEEKAEELQQIFSSGIEEWRVFLHPIQRELVTKSFEGPVWVRGAAGTGKTVVAMHRAKWLAENIVTPGRNRILLTTFTTSLAEDINDNLKLLCSAELFNRIDVLNLDKFVYRTIREYHPELRILYGDELTDLWKKVHASSPYNEKFSLDFLITEQERIVAPRAIESRTDYLKVRRTGRGIRLNRLQKMEVWSILSAYREECVRTNVLDPGSAINVVRRLIESGKFSSPYASIVVDETQDFNENALSLIRALAGEERSNDLFLVGDDHQRLYGSPVNLLDSGIDTLSRQEILRINYRTTDEIGQYARAILQKNRHSKREHDFQDGRGYRSLTHGPKPIHKNLLSQQQMVEEIADTIKCWIENGFPPESICVAVRMKKQVSNLKKSLAKAGVSTYEIKANGADERGLKGVRISTMHRIKGLEFDGVIIAEANDGLIPLKAFIEAATDLIDQKEKLKREQLLLYVAATRARKDLIVLSFGKPSPFISEVQDPL